MANMVRRKKPASKPKGRRVYRGRRPSVAATVKKYIRAMTPKVEKKIIDVSVGQVQQQVAQVSGNSTGHWAFEVSPAPANSTAQNGMIGNEIQLTSCFYDFQFISQSAMTLGQRLKMYIIQVKGLPINVAAAGTMFLDPTNFITSSTIYDLHSPRNMDYAKNFKLLKTHNVTIKADNYGTQGNQFVRIKGGLKFKKPITQKYSTNITEGQIICLIVADSGNSSPSTASTIPNIPVTAVNTGTNFFFNWRNYYTDA